MAPELKQAIDDLGSTFEEFKAANDERIKQLETARGEDVVTAEKVERINEAVTKFDETVEAIKAEGERLGQQAEELEKRYDLLETAFKRLPAGDGQKEALTPERIEYAKAFDRFLRKGNPVDVEVPEEFKALTVGSEPDGGFWVTPEMSSRVVRKIFETSPVRSVASVLSISTDRVEFMVDTDEAGSNWTETEQSAVTETDTPEMAKKVITTHELAAEPRATQRLLDDASVDVEGWLEGKVAAKFARAENTAFVNGSGVGQPRGFTTYAAGVPTFGTWQVIEQVNSGVANDVGADGLIDLQNSLKDAYLANARWAMKRSTVGNVRKLKDTQNQYLWQPGLQLGEPSSLLGHEIVRMDDMPAVAADALAIAFADWAEAYQIIDRIGIRILRDPFTTKPFIKFYTTKRVGGDVLNFEAIKLQKLAV